MSRKKVIHTWNATRLRACLKFVGAQREVKEDEKGLRDFVTHHKGFQDFKVGSKVFKAHDFPSTTPLSDLQQSDGWKDTVQCEYLITTANLCQLHLFIFCETYDKDKTETVHGISSFAIFYINKKTLSINIRTVSL